MRYNVSPRKNQKFYNFPINELCIGKILKGTTFFLFFLFFLSFFFSSFVWLFSINIQLNNCYLIKCNRQQEKNLVSREKIVHHILNIWINNLNFYHFLPFTVGKPELITTWSFSKQCSHQFFLQTDSNYSSTFQNASRTFNVTFDSFKSHCLTNASINRMCRSITIFQIPQSIKIIKCAYGRGTFFFRPNFNVYIHVVNTEKKKTNFVARII